jgi:hypothetical protein
MEIEKYYKLWAKMTLEGAGSWEIEDMVDLFYITRKSRADIRAISSRISNDAAMVFESLGVLENMICDYYEELEGDNSNEC